MVYLQEKSRSNDNLVLVLVLIASTLRSLPPLDARTGLFEYRGTWRISEQKNSTTKKGALPMIVDARPYET